MSEGTSKKAIVVKIYDDLLANISALASLYRLRDQNRFSVPADARRVVDKLITVAGRVHGHCILPAREAFYRARKHDEFKWSEEPLPKPFTSEEMKAPPREKATAGRLNSEGIPYLYVATDETTAVAEVRPWTGAFVSVATLVLERAVKVVDFCGSSSPDPDMKRTWREVGEMFAVPHHPGDNLRYLITQYLAEAFKAAGFNGIRYKSGLSESGQNIALFDCAAASVEGGVSCVLVQNVKYSYKKIRTAS